MATVYIPAQLRDLCGGAANLEVPATTLGELLRAMDLRCPGFFARVVEDGRVRAGLSVAIDGEALAYPMHEPLRPTSQVTIIPAIAGG